MKKPLALTTVAAEVARYDATKPAPSREDQETAAVRRLVDSLVWNVLDFDISRSRIARTRER